MVWWGLGGCGGKGGVAVYAPVAQPSAKKEEKYMIGKVRLSMVKRLSRSERGHVGIGGEGKGIARSFQVQMLAPSADYSSTEKIEELRRNGVVMVDNGMCNIPGVIADHHAPQAVEEKYRNLVASELVLTPEWRRALVERDHESPITAIYAHKSPYDRDGGIAQFLVKEILEGRISKEGLVPEVYQNLARYANSGDKFTLPYVKTPEYTLEGLFHGMNGVHGEDFDSIIKATDAIIKWIVATKINPNNVKEFMEFVENSLAYPPQEYAVTINQCIRPYVEQKRKALQEFEESEAWKYRVEFQVLVPTEDGEFKSVNAVQVRTKNMGAVYELVYGRNLDPRIAVISIPGGPTWVSIRPDAAKEHGVNLYPIIRRLQEAEAEAGSRTVWYNQPVYNFTVTYPTGGPTKLNPSQILRVIKTPPVLLIISGLPGEEKTSIAKEISAKMSLANHLGMPVFSSDKNGIIYEGMIKHAESILRSGVSTAMVGSFIINKDEISLAVELARRYGAMPIVVSCEEKESQILTPEERMNMGLIIDRTYLKIALSGSPQEIAQRIMERLIYTFEEIANPSAKKVISQFPFIKPKKPFLLLVSGLPGAGKSTITDGLGENRHLDVAVFLSDVVRKEKEGIKPYDHSLKARPFEGIYSKENTRVVYEEIRARAEEEIKRGRNVVVDASFNGFNDPQSGVLINFREMFHKLAEETGSAFIILDAKTDDEVAKNRIAARKITISDANPEIIDALVKVAVPITQEERAQYGLTENTFIELDTSSLLVGEVIDKAIEKLNHAFAEINES